MANTIKVYPHDSNEFRALETVASELTKRSAAGFTYDVEDVYFDFGQDWMWTTIVVHTPSNESWQILCPRDHERILYAQDLRPVIDDIKKDLYRDSEEKPSMVSADIQTDHSARLEFLSTIVEVFEDFLDRRGIVIPNEDKAEDPDASNIYGMDFAELSDGVEEVLIKYGFLKEGV